MGDAAAKGGVSGACRCGRVTFRVTAPPIMTAACHCRGCQAMTGSAFSLSAMIPADGFQVTAGQPVIAGLKGPVQHHHFCPDCMTWMFTRIAGVDAFVNIRPTLLEDGRWCVPFIETMTRDRLPWVQTPARHAFDGFPPTESYPALMAEFAALG